MIFLTLVPFSPLRINLDSRVDLSNSTLDISVVNRITISKLGSMPTFQENSSRSEVVVMALGGAYQSIYCAPYSTYT